MKKQLYENHVLLPLKSNKAPNINTWKVLSPDKKVPFDSIEKSETIGFACGFGGYEVIDIDNHFGDADDLFQFIYDNYDLSDYPIVKTRGGGYHIYYRCEKPNGNQKYAVREVTENDESKHGITPNGGHFLQTHEKYAVSLTKKDGNMWTGRSTIIESRGVGGYVVCPPSPGYKLIQGNISEPPMLSQEEKDALESLCVAMNEVAKESSNIDKSSNGSNERPGDVYNSDSSNIEITKSILSNAGWNSKDEKHWCRPGKSIKDGISATFGKVGDDKFYVFSSNAHPFEDGKSYSMFAVKTMCEFNGDYSEAAKSLMPKTSSKKPRKKSPEKSDPNLMQYVRVGCKYYKKIESFDKKKNRFFKFEKWDRQTLVDDFGKDFLQTVQKFDEFVNIPSHTDYEPIIGSSYNMYAEVLHEKKKGEFPTIEMFMKHIFGDGTVISKGKEYSELEIGYDYFKIMWEKPTHLLPILCLVSEENQTGKTTFGNFLNAIFGNNFSSIGQQELKTEFNSSYATKLVAMVDESWIDYKIIDKLKQLGTAEKIMLRQMHKDHNSIDFFCKFILCSNRVKDFIIANEHDERYWVRTLKKAGGFDPNFLDKLTSEIKYFLYFLENREMHTPAESRMHFSPTIIRTKAFETVVKNSKDKHTKDFVEMMLEIMESNEIQQIDATLKDLKESFFSNQYDMKISMIKSILQDELKLEPQDSPKRYTFFKTNETKKGRFYELNIDSFKKLADVSYTNDEVPDNSSGAELNLKFDDDDDLPF
ncbi:MAG: DUF5906 domain-containing protein [Prolixibacteraceae bacterium]|nr:DUF5906 domain-containing protein [Prolixibacteraceae bacterium]